MHYANGREAKVGDQVVGRVYNTAGVVAGTLVSLTPGLDACSAQVEFIVTTAEDDKVEPPRMKLHQEELPRRARKTERHGEDGPYVRIYVCRDYTQASYLLHAEDAQKAFADALIERTAKVS